MIENVQLAEAMIMAKKYFFYQTQQPEAEISSGFSPKTYDGNVTVIIKSETHFVSFHFFEAIKLNIGNQFLELIVLSSESCHVIYCCEKMSRTEIKAL